MVDFRRKRRRKKKKNTEKKCSFREASVTTALLFILKRRMKECQRAYITIHPGRDTHTPFTPSDWLSLYTNVLPLITIKLVTLVSMRNKHT